MLDKRILGFARSELLVVGICLVLSVGFWIFVFTPDSHKDEAATKVVCNTNLKALGFGMLQYALDHEDMIPGRGWQFDVKGWMRPTREQLDRSFQGGYIWDYANAEKTYTCPALGKKHNPKPRIKKGKHGPNVWGWPGGEGTANLPGPMWSYCLNGQAGQSQGDIRSVYRVNPDLIQPAPDKVFMLFEEDDMDYHSFDNDVVLFSQTHPQLLDQDSLGAYHNIKGTIQESGQGSYIPENNPMTRREGEGNLVFFDGHVGGMLRSEFDKQRSSPAGTKELCGGYSPMNAPNGDNKVSFK